MKYIPFLAVGLFLLIMLRGKKSDDPKKVENPEDKKPEEQKDVKMNRGTDPNPKKFETKEAFYKTLLPVAQAIEKAKNIPHQFVISQLALESGYGKSAPHFNMFGRKAKKGKDGKPVEPYFTSWTWEELPDLSQIHKFPEYDASKTVKKGEKYLVRVKDYFRAYENFTEALQSYVSLLDKAQRYQGAKTYALDWVKYGTAIAKAGYTTTPSKEYMDALISIFTKLSKLA